MIENKTQLSRPLVIGHHCNGRRRYDPLAKQELVESCLQPGTSIARQALDHGINANLLRKWIKQYQARPSVATANYPGSTPSAFVPVVMPIAAKTAEMELTVTLVNGVQLAIQGVGLADCSPLLNALATLPCSASTQG